MQRRWRWTIVALGTAVLVSLPLAARLLPAGDSDLDARTLLDRVTASASVPYSGFAQTQSSLSVPVDTGVFSALGDLFGSTSQLRVWWRDAQDWRVDTIGLTGESDLYQSADGLRQWDFESGTAQAAAASTGPQVRLPRADDLVPPNLARRLLSEAAPGDVTRLPGRRVAGEQTAGLRLDIADPRSTIDHVDVWARPSDGLPLRVDVVADGASAPITSSTFLDVDVTRPDAATTTFRPAAGTPLRVDGPTDVLSFTDRFGRSEPPATVAGLTRRTDLPLGAVGAYGRGATLVVAVPLSARLAGIVVPELRKAPGVVEDSAGIAAGVGPLNLQLSAPAGYGARWLLVGTVTARTLLDAVVTLPPAQGFGYRP